MLKRMVFSAVVVMLASMPAYAQPPKAEIGVTAGWVFSDGVSGNSVTVPAGTFNRIDPKDSFGWGLDVGFFVGENAEVGFQFTQQPTKLQLGGTTTKDIGNLSTFTYHATFTYNFGGAEARVRPYIMGGLGATSFGNIDYTKVNGSAGTIQGFSNFSTSWGAGVKVYGASKVGGRFGMRWTPMYVKSDATGWWCDPYWGCYLTGSAQYANQFELNGGITLKF